MDKNEKLGLEACSSHMTAVEGQVWDRGGEKRKVDDDTTDKNVCMACFPCDVGKYKYIDLHYSRLSFTQQLLFEASKRQSIPWPKRHQRLHRNCAMRPI